MLPKLLLFAPCEKVIIDQQNNISMIGILQGIETPVPPGTDIPLDATDTIRWDILTLWQPESGETGRQFEQLVDLHAPDGKRVMKVKVLFKLEGSTTRTIANIHGFPIGQAGNYVLKLRLREDVEGSRFAELAVFPIQVKRGETK